MKIFLSIEQTIRGMACTLLCGLAITTTSCSKEEESNAPEETMKSITATANTPEEGLQTRLGFWENSGRMWWAIYDSFGVWPLDKEKNYTRFNHSGNSGTEFRGEVLSKEGDMLCAVFPQMPMEEGEIHFDLRTQECANCYSLYMYAMAKLEDNAVNFLFRPLVAVIRIDEIPNSGLEKHATKATLTADGLRLTARMKMTSDGPLLTPEQATRQSVTVTDWWTDSVLYPSYICLFDDDLKNVEIVITDGTITYKAKLKDKKLEVGTLYDVDNTLFVKQ